VRLGVGIDRLDYTKGINEKFLAIERVLEQHPELRGRFAFVQVAEPSRDCLPEYRSARDQLGATAARVNARFGRSGSNRSCSASRTTSRRRCIGLYQGCGLLLRRQSARRDESGREGIRQRADDERGVLILSQATGAARQLREALLINPWALESSSDAVVQALTMPEIEQTNRMRRLRVPSPDPMSDGGHAGLLADAASVHCAADRGAADATGPATTPAVQLPRESRTAAAPMAAAAS
jgi:trehalose 6-phosphate synthase